MKALYVTLIVIAIIALLYIVYRNTIGRKGNILPGAITPSTRNDKDLTRLTFLEANNFTPNEPTFSFP